jgi:hypothetical protein
LLIDAPSYLTVAQLGCAHRVFSNPTASAELGCLRVQQLSANQLHAGNGRAFSTTPLDPTNHQAALFV